MIFLFVSLFVSHLISWVLNRASPNEAIPLSTAALVAIANMHVIDQGIRDIAKQFRFTVEEVQEFYDRCGEMGLTRSRFQRMREELQSRFKDDIR